ncbi:hypothetical protein LINGRAHAP2_LOCUS26405 [Linum grandiflorum]
MGDDDEIMNVLPWFKRSFSLDRIAGSASQHNILETADNSGEMELIRLDNEMCNDANSMSLVKVGLLSMEIPVHIGGDHPKLVLWAGVSNGITVAVLPLKESNHHGAWEYTLVATDVIEDANDVLRARAK